MAEFRTCTSCGYRRGFHIYFKPFKNEHRLALICPECGQSYDFGLMIKGLRQRPHRGATFDKG